MSVGLALGLCMTAFIAGLLLMGLFCYMYVRRRRPRIPGSPHYISSKQNPYVTVPLKDAGSHHTKRALSFSSSASSSNGLTMGSQKIPSGAAQTPKLFTKPHAEYETATIKRNSHSLNGHIRADLDQDKFFWLCFLWRRNATWLPCFSFKSSGMMNPMRLWEKLVLFENICYYKVELS